MSRLQGGSAAQAAARSRTGDPPVVEDEQRLPLVTRPWTIVTNPAVTRGRAGHVETPYLMEDGHHATR
ncbi:hypothetical protein, partial [Nonomuraea sp. NPDC005730]|uniref:hypothetical protein n=1 Tax=Nonomuraea sp. NPDC005730 TaxID=3157055 RepID=UPI0033FE1A2D